MCLILTFPSCSLHRWLPTWATWREVRRVCTWFYKRLQSIVPLLISSNYDSLCYFVSVTEWIIFFHHILPPKTMGHNLTNLHVLNLEFFLNCALLYSLCFWSVGCAWLRWEVQNTNEPLAATFISDVPELVLNVTETKSLLKKMKSTHLYRLRIRGWV